MPVTAAVFKRTIKMLLLCEFIYTYIHTYIHTHTHICTLFSDTIPSNLQCTYNFQSLNTDDEERKDGGGGGIRG
jgi:hypothetical protein